MKRVVELTIEIDLSDASQVKDWFDVFKEHMLKLHEGELVVTNLTEIKELDNGNS